MSKPLRVTVFLLCCIGGLIGAWLALPTTGAGAATPVTATQPSGTWAVTDPELGRKAYVMCQACHGADGQGVPGFAPPLANSQWLSGPALPAILITLHGFDASSEPGSAYVSARMLGHGKQLADHEVAGLLSWLRSRWNRGGPVTVTEVAEARTRFREHDRPWTPAELRALQR